MELKPERLTSQLAAEPLKPIYLIAGAEPLLVMEAADAIRAQARASGYADREVFDADGRDFDWDALNASFAAPGLFSARRVIELRLPTGKPGNEGAKVIGDYCADPPADTLLLITTNEWSLRHAGKWSEAITRIGHCVIAWPVKPHELQDWIERRLRAKGVRADQQAVMRLSARIEGNLLAAAQEIDKLALLAEGQTLDVTRMEALVTDAARFDAFGLTDAILNGQSAQVSRMLAALRAEGEAVPAVLGALSKSIFAAAALAQVQAKGGNLAAAFKSQGIWESKQALYRRALQRHNALRWQQFVAQLGQVDRIAKGRAAGDAWQVLERLSLAIAEPKAIKLLPPLTSASA